ncbi:hypothetical protein ACFS7Z_14955 [Pontibacter toksunensis]|uniref:Uncharacterized protein n=1 Tax=Pontibacter toksunensis TaxID=1332631 RepID=A0ABW6BZ61_9BACT
MNELDCFYEKLYACDFIALTPINEGLFYCRFYSKGLYLDRMFITDLSLQEELILLSEEDEIINEENVSRLKDKFVAFSRSKDEEGTLETAGGE